MDREQLERVKDVISQLRDMREGTAGEVYGAYSGAISSLRRILRSHGTDSEPR